MTMKNVVLFCTLGNSDKEYRIRVVDAGGDGFHVVCMNGRRGGSLTTHQKTSSPVALEEANKIASKLEREKLAKGYTEAESGVAYALTDKAGAVSGWLPQLCTPIVPERTRELIADPQWVAQEKFDGNRRGLMIAADGVKGMNRKGLFTNIPGEWLDAVKNLPMDTILDGEQVGGVLHVFDVVQIGGVDVTGLGFVDREARLCELSNLLVGSSIRWQMSARGADAKAGLMQAVEEAHGEGVVWRRVDGQYQPGEAQNSRDAVLLKFKFLESCTCIVTGVTCGKRSVQLGVLDATGKEVDVGKVTIPANHEVPKEGDIVDVRFLYKFEQGALFQPVYGGKRLDQGREDALLSKIVRIKKKTDDADQEDEAALVDG